MRKFKKIILAVLCVICVISLMPNTAQAEECLITKKNIVRWNLEENTPDSFISQFIAAGCQGYYTKINYYYILDVKAKSVKEARKKYVDFMKKVKTAKANKYGLGFGLTEGYELESHINGYSIYIGISCNEAYYIQKLFDEAMKEPYLEVFYNNRDTQVSTNFYRQKTKSVFKNADAVKKSSDSVKLQFLAEYLNGSCKLAWGKGATDYEKSLQAVVEGNYCGTCAELANLWRTMFWMISDGIEFKEYIVNRDDPNFSHECLLIRAKNKDGKWDYFSGNNAGCTPFGHAFLKEYDKGVNIYKAASKGCDYNTIEDWMHYDKKAYVDGYGSFGKSAYKYGKNHKKSELVNLMISKKAKYL